jgi:hypothetical protein
MLLRSVRVTRYVTPLREGGSLPAVVEADDDGLYVLKFRGAGQGPRALVAEVVAGELARALGLPVPELVLADLDADLARTEPDPEIQSLIRASAGLNVAMDYLPGAVGFDPAVVDVEPGLASRIVWFDAFVSNVDRTARNTNMLMWHRRLWLIDHGAALFFHHTPGWQDDAARRRDVFALVRDHVLLRRASALADADAALAPEVTPPLIDAVLQCVPDAWLDLAPLPDAQRPDPIAATAVRAHYRDYLLARLAPPRHFVEEARRVR